jgi:hypothetical protein
MASLDGAMTTPQLYEAAGMDRNQWIYFLDKNPRLKRLRVQLGNAWVWPAAALEEVKRLRAEAQKGEVAR